MRSCLRGRASLTIAVLVTLVVACKSSSSSNRDICSKLSSYVNECGTTTPCDVAETAACPQTIALYSSAYIAALESCLDAPSNCLDDGGRDSVYECVAGKAQELAPSPVLLKLKADVCAVCPDGKSPTVPASCSGFLGADSGVGVGAGEVVLAFNDTIIQKVDQQCVDPSADAGPFDDCAVQFLNCENMFVEQLLAPPAACSP